MADIRVDRVTIGSPTYKVTVGDYTRVLKIEVGIPTRNVLVSNSVLLEDVIGVTITDPITEGQLLVVDSTGEFVNSSTLGGDQRIDGRVYERDSERGEILIRRSPTDGVPTNLRGGELAYSYLSNSGGAINNGGERLYIGVDSVSSGFASRIDIIGGKYFTSLLDHDLGTLTPSSAILVDSIGRVDSLLVGDITSTNLIADSASITNLAVSGTIQFGQLDPNDLVNSLDDVLRGGTAIEITFDSTANTASISAKLATDDSAGIVLLDSVQFNTVDGVTSLVILSGGTF